MIFQSPYYRLNKKALDYFQREKKSELLLGDLIAAIWIYDQDQFPVPGFLYKNEEKIGTFIKSHFFFTTNGILLIDKNLNGDFFTYDSIEKLEVNKSLFTANLQIFFDSRKESNITLIDLPIKAKAAQRILNYKNDLDKYLKIISTK